jgi:hypothetical protein
VRATASYNIGRRNGKKMLLMKLKRESDERFENYLVHEARIVNAERHSGIPGFRQARQSHAQCGPGCTVRRRVSHRLSPGPSRPPTTQRKLKNAAAAQPESIFAGAVTWHGFGPRGPIGGRDERSSLRLCFTGRRHDICVRVGGTTVRDW